LGEVVLDDKAITLWACAAQIASGSAHRAFCA